MDNIKNDNYYLQKIIKDLTFVTAQMQDVNINDLSTNEILLDSMMFRMIQISENSRNLSDKYKENHADIPWNAVYGFRNRIVHDYGSVDLNIVYETLKNDIPDLLELLSEK